MNHKFEWKSDIQNISLWKRDSGFNSHFCKGCGSPVPNRIGENLVWIPIGLLDQVGSSVAAHLFDKVDPNEDDDQSIKYFPDGPVNVNEFAKWLEKKGTS